MTKNIQKILQKATVCLLLYFVMVAKCNAFGTAPSVAVPPVAISVLNGGTGAFTVIDYYNLSGVSFKWYYDGQEITKGIVNTTTTATVLGISLSLAPTSILTVTNINSANIGKYSVVSYNVNGSITNSVSLLLEVPPVISIINSASTLTMAGFHLQMSTPVGSNVVVEASSDMHIWTPIYTNLNSSGTLNYTDTDATNHTARYYRARTQ